jgi:hypothetical protein
MIPIGYTRFLLIFISLCLFFIESQCIHSFLQEAELLLPSHSVQGFFLTQFHGVLKLEHDFSVSVPIITLPYLCLQFILHWHFHHNIHSTISLNTSHCFLLSSSWSASQFDCWLLAQQKVSSQVLYRLSPRAFFYLYVSGANFKASFVVSWPDVVIGNWKHQLLTAVGG